MKEKMYSIAYRKRDNKNDFFWNHNNYMFKECNIDCGYRYWLADPFLFEKNGVVYLFYEAYDLIQRRGKIGYSILEEGKRSSAINIIIEEPHHLSFPFIFEKNGDVFIMPETCEANNIKLYKATDFPYKWEITRTIVKDIFTCDTIMADISIDKKYLLTSEMYRKNVPNNNYASCWVKNKLFPIDKDFGILGQGLLIAEGDYGIRNAGNFVSYNNVIYRVGQNCRGRLYGRGLVFYEVKSFEPYIETEEFAIDCTDFSDHISRNSKNEIVGVHTYNNSDNYEIIDFSEIRNVQFLTDFMRKHEGKITHFTNKIYRLKNKIRRLLSTSIIL